MAEAYGQALLACDAVARDPAGKVTLYGIFDRIWSPKFPAVHPLFSIYWRCHVPGPGRVSVIVLKPDGSPLVEVEPVETGKQEIHLIQGTQTLGGIEFPVEGDYTLVLRYNNSEILRSALHLTRRQTE